MCYPDALLLLLLLLVSAHLTRLLAMPMPLWLALPAVQAATVSWYVMGVLIVVVVVIVVVVLLLLLPWLRGKGLLAGLWCCKHPNPEHSRDGCGHPT